MARDPYFANAATEHQAGKRPPKPRPEPQLTPEERLRLAIYGTLTPKREETR